MESAFGNLISEHQENKTAAGSTLLIALACFGLAALMAFFFYGEREISFNKILFGFAGVASFAGGVGCLQSLFRNRNVRVRLYENGMVVEKGGKVHSAAWDDIALVRESVEEIYFKGKYVYDRYSYTIEKRDGESFLLSNMVSDIDQVGKTVKAKTLASLYPEAVEKIRTGGQVLFDSLAVDKNGLGGIPWAELSGVKIERGVIEVKDRSGKAVVSGSYAATPNAHLLVALLKDHLPVDG